MELQQQYEAKVKEVHSGDDLVVLVDLAHDGLYKRVRVRLQGVDTPDAHKASPSAEAGKVRDMVHTMTRNRDCKIHKHAVRKNGWLVTLYVKQPDGEMLDMNKLLRDSGFIFTEKR